MTIMSDIIVPALTRSVSAQVRDASMFDCEITSIAVLRYRQDTGAFPDTLTQLVPTYITEVPPDSFDGLPLRYLHDDGGFTVYSIGPNKKDDGGSQPEEKKNILTSGDLTFTVRLRAKSGT